MLTDGHLKCRPPTHRDLLLPTLKKQQTWLVVVVVQRRCQRSLRGGEIQQYCPKRREFPQICQRSQRERRLPAHRASREHHRGILRGEPRKRGPPHFASLQRRNDGADKRLGVGVRQSTQQAVTQSIAFKNAEYHVPKEFYSCVQHFDLAHLCGRMLAIDVIVRGEHSQGAEPQ